jgi:L-asparagine permease
MTQVGVAQADTLNAEQVGYTQSLGRRQVQMIAIGAAIATGLFLGSASRLHSTGPALVLSYAFVGASRSC